jgi:hypothetical protein
MMSSNAPSSPSPPLLSAAAAAATTGNEDSIEPVLRSPPRPKRISSPSSSVVESVVEQASSDQNQPPNNLNANNAQWPHYHDYGDYGYGNTAAEQELAGGGGLFGLDFLPSTASIVDMIPCWHQSFPFVVVNDNGINNGINNSLVSQMPYMYTAEQDFDEYQYRPEHQLSTRARNGEAFPLFRPVAFVDMKDDEAHGHQRDSPQAAEVNNATSIFDAPTDVLVRNLPMR